MSLPRTAGLMLLLGLAGCATVWVKPGATEQDFQVMQSNCTARAFQRYPASLQQVQTGPPYFVPPMVQCGGWGPYYRCVTVPGQWMPPSYALVDVNQSPRSQDIQSGFYENGWSPQQ